MLVALEIVISVIVVLAFRTHAQATAAYANNSNPATVVTSITTEALAPNLLPQPAVSNVQQLQSPATEVHARDGYYVRGIDRVDGRLLVIDDAENALRQSSDWGLTWSRNKGLPNSVAPADVSKIVRFGAYLYLLAETVSYAGVWRASPAVGDTPFEWSPRLLTLTRGARVIMTDLETSTWGANDYLFCGEYGDPVGGPSIWRISLADANGDGRHWTRAYGPDPRDRHIHAVAPDPYNPGSVWAAIGDGGPRTIIRSTNYGATWSVVFADYMWQGVQISFDSSYVYVASDQPRFTYYVIDRTTLRPMVGSPNWHGAFAISPPAPRNARYYSIAYYGSVDPATGTYYCVANDESSPGNWMGMFVAPRVRSLLRVFDKGGHDIAMNGEIFVANNTLYSGIWQHSLIPSND